MNTWEVSPCSSVIVDQPLSIRKLELRAEEKRSREETRRLTLDLASLRDNAEREARQARDESKRQEKIAKAMVVRDNRTNSNCCYNLNCSCCSKHA